MMRDEDPLMPFLQRPRKIGRWPPEDSKLEGCVWEPGLPCRALDE